MNSLSIIREKAAARQHPPGHGRRRGAGADSGRRPQGQADPLQPAVERREVHQRGRPGDAARQPSCRAPTSASCPARGPAGASRSPTTSSTEFLEISVTDSGIGISADGLEQLFQPFSQIDSGLARKFEGTGLGLAMVKLLAELHGGAVAVRERGRRGLLLHGLAAAARRRRTRPPAPVSAAVPRVEAVDRARAPRWWWKTTSSRPT